MVKVICLRMFAKMSYKKIEFMKFWEKTFKIKNASSGLDLASIGEWILMQQRSSHHGHKEFMEDKHFIQLNNAIGLTILLTSNPNHIGIVA